MSFSADPPRVVCHFINVEAANTGSVNERWDCNVVIHTWNGLKFERPEHFACG